MKKAFYALPALFIFLLQTQTYAQGWSKLDSAGLSGNQIVTICSDPSGNIYVAGDLWDDSATFYVAKFDGTTWSELGGVKGLGANAEIRIICSDQAGNIYAGGDFTNTQGSSYVAKYDGSTWSELGGINALKANHEITTLCVDKSGNIYAAGAFSNGATSEVGNRYVAKYDGATWSELGDTCIWGSNSLYSICTDKAGNIYAAGSGVAKYDGTSWSSLGGPDVETICTDSSGNIYISGVGKNASGNRYVDKYDGTSWTELGGLNGLSANGGISGVCSDAAGNIYVAGHFTNSDTHYYVAVYNGTNWSELGGFNSSGASKWWINSICTDSKGTIYAAVDFYVEKYVAGTTGIYNLGKGNSLEVSPNPTNNTIAISLGNSVSRATLKLFDLTGQVVKEQTDLDGNRFMLDMSAISPGIYFVHVQEKENVWVGKVVKTR